MKIINFEIEGIAPLKMEIEDYNEEMKRKFTIPLVSPEVSAEKEE